MHLPPCKPHLFLLGETQEAIAFPRTERLPLFHLEGAGRGRRRKRNPKEKAAGRGEREKIARKEMPVVFLDDVTSACKGHSFSSPCLDRSMDGHDAMMSIPSRSSRKGLHQGRSRFRKNGVPPVVFVASFARGFCRWIFTTVFYFVPLDWTCSSLGIDRSWDDSRI